MIPNPKVESSTAKTGESQAQIQLMRKGMLRILYGCLVVMLLVSFLLIWKLASSAFELAFFLGASVGIANGIIGFLTIEKFIDKSSLLFLKGVFIGMGIRLLLLLGIFILFVKVFAVHIIGFVTGLLIFYFVMTIFEVVFLNKRIEIKRTIKAAL